jgi:hypothetical protein
LRLRLLQVVAAYKKTTTDSGNEAKPGRPLQNCICIANFCGTSKLDLQNNINNYIDAVSDFLRPIHSYSFQRTSRFGLTDAILNNTLTFLPFICCQQQQDQKIPSRTLLHKEKKMNPSVVPTMDFTSSPNESQSHEITALRTQIMGMFNIVAIDLSETESIQSNPSTHSSLFNLSQD